MSVRSKRLEEDLMLGNWGFWVCVNDFLSGIFLLMFLTFLGLGLELCGWIIDLLTNGLDNLINKSAASYKC
jgi:hypothetical protein